MEKEKKINRERGKTLIKRGKYGGKRRKTYGKRPI